ncbi:hypothetical protein [Paenibacillus ottowii]
MKVVSYEGGFVPIHDRWNAELLYDNARLIAESREALPYWLQKAKKEEERAEDMWRQAQDFKTDYDRILDAYTTKSGEVESLIQQKDAEIARLTKIINDATDENERLLSGEGTEEYESALTELLKEDTP